MSRLSDESLFWILQIYIPDVDFKGHPDRDQAAPSVPTTQMPSDHCCQVTAPAP